VAEDMVSLVIIYAVSDCSKIRHFLIAELSF
jgi:hypothetical protein